MVNDLPETLATYQVVLELPPELATDWDVEYRASQSTEAKEVRWEPGRWDRGTDPRWRTFRPFGQLPVLPRTVLPIGEFRWNVRGDREYASEYYVAYTVTAERNVWEGRFGPYLVVDE